MTSPTTTNSVVTTDSCFNQMWNETHHYKYGSLAACPRSQFPTGFVVAIAGKGKQDLGPTCRVSLSVGFARTRMSAIGRFERPLGVESERSSFRIADFRGDPDLQLRERRLWPMTCRPTSRVG